MGDLLELEHRAFPLRPAPDPGVAFKGTYREEAWRRCAQMSAGDGITYIPYAGARYPDWSLPALEAAKCVARQGREAFDRVHLRLYEALFTHSRNIADVDEVITIVGEAGVDRGRFLADYRAGVGREAVIRDCTAAADDGVRSIPTVVFESRDAAGSPGRRAQPEAGALGAPRVIVGLADLAQYRAAFEEAARC